MNEQSQELDFNSDDYNTFYYTSDKQIKRMDDSFIISKIIEKYPDFIPERGENLLKQVFTAIVYDTYFINGITNEFDIDILELFKIIYRNYSFIFNKCFITKIHRIISKKSYVKNTIRRAKRGPGRPRKAKSTRGKVRSSRRSQKI